MTWEQFVIIVLIVWIIGYEIRLALLVSSIESLKDIAKNLATAIYPERFR